MLMPGAEAGDAAGRARRREPAVRRSPRSPRTPTSPPPTSTSSPTPNAAKVLVETEQPAGDAGRRRARPSGVSADVFAAWKKLNDGRRPDPVPGLHDADVLRRHLGARSRSCWPARTTPTQFTKDVQADYDKWKRHADTAPLTIGRRDRRASRGASPTCTCCRRSSSSRAFVLVPLVHAAWLSLFAVGRPHARARGSGSTTTGDVVSRPGAALARSCTRWSCSSSTRCCRSLIGAACWPARCRARRVRGLAAVPDDPVPAAGDRAGRRRGDVADDLRARRRAAQRRAARGRPRLAGAGLARRLHARRCRRSG